ncbi:MAG: RnfABCDGE type electron transport complex subunit D [Deltaproteobacteria bacterium]|nr:RnfABCDGE type electron transport complex subunit D [Deltaproteobacteria bacterium]
MINDKLLIGSHAPFWHNGSSISSKSYHVMLAALPAVIMGISQYGAPALAVLAFSVAWAMIWELLLKLIMKRPMSIGDGNAAVIGLLLGMLLPASAPWWLVITGTFVAIIVGKEIWGGIGCNPLNPTLVALAILMLSWKSYLHFNGALVNYDFDFNMMYPLIAVKHFGTYVSQDYSLSGMFMGQQPGAIGATFGLGLLIGGLYLILRGLIRWEISLSFLVGVFVMALLFNIAHPEKYAGPMFHILTGYTMIGAFFLATEDSSSPVYFLPMIIYGLGAGAITVLVRNIGFFPDGVVFAILLMNIANPLIDKIRPRALGKGLENA